MLTSNTAEGQLLRQLCTDDYVECVTTVAESMELALEVMYVVESARVS